MAFNFANLYNVERKFDIDTTDFEYMNLENLYEISGSDSEAVYTIRGLYINTKSIYGDAPVVALDDRYVNLPGYLKLVVDSMINNKECVAAINRGECGFKIRPYKNRKYENKLCYGVEWVNILPKDIKY